MSPKAAAAQAHGRALAILLPSLAFQIHSIFLILALHESTFDKVLDWPKSYFIAFNFCAAAAGLMGMWGAVSLNTTLVKACASIHATTLLLGTLTLLNIIVPFDLRTLLPVLPNLKFDVAEFCQTEDDSFGWDDHWQDQCRSGLNVVKHGAVWTGLALMAVQWWALGSIWCWNKRVEEAENESEGQEEYEGQRLDIEKARDWDEKVSIVDSRSWSFTRDSDVPPE